MPTTRTAALAIAIGLALAPLVAGAPTRAAEPDAPPVFTEIIVRVDPEETTIAAVNTAAGTTTIAASIAEDGAYLVALPSGADGEATIGLIDLLPGVDWAVGNTALSSPEMEAGRIYAWRIYAWATADGAPAESTYAAAAINLDAAHRVARGAGVTLAVIDTGINPAHPSFAGSLVAGHDFVDGDEQPWETANAIDDDGDGLVDEGAGHGTHVAGIVHQVAPDAVIMPIRVLDDEGSGTMWNATEAMYWAADHGARVINMSLGTHGSARPMREAVTALLQRGVLVVAAAGNDGKDRPSYPAAAIGAIGVGSVGAGDVISTFSNTGLWVSLMAPGENIHSAFGFPAGSYAMNSGTSMAAPWVAGGAALVLSKRPSLAPAQVSDVLRLGAASIAAANPRISAKSTAGRLDLAASLAKI